MNLKTVVSFVLGFFWLFMGSVFAAEVISQMPIHDKNKTKTFPASVAAHLFAKSSRTTVLAGSPQ